MKRIQIPGVTRLANISLRAKLIIANIVLATLAIAVVGGFSFNSTARTSQFLTGQFSDSETKRAENDLRASAERYANNLDSFFATIDNSMSILGSNMTGVFSQEQLIGGGQNWDARLRLTQLPSGNWDNSNAEPGSIFLPGSKSPQNNYIEINTLKQLDFLAPGILKNKQDLIAVYFGSVRGETFYYPNVDLSALLPNDFDITQRPWYIAANPINNPKRDVVWSEPYVDAASNGLVVTCSVPVYDELDQFRGVAAMDLKLAQITDLVSSIRFGNSGYAFVIDQDGHLIALSEKGYLDFGVTSYDIAEGTYLKDSLMKNAPLELFGVLAKMSKFQSGVSLIELGGVKKYIAFRPIPTVGYSLGVVVDQAETQQNVTATKNQISQDNGRTLLNLAGVMVVVWIVFLIASQTLGSTLIAPLTRLTQIARQIAEGDLEAKISAQSGDEVGVLANTLNTMTSNLRSVIDVTEQRVVERTSQLQHSMEQSQRRANELRTISVVSRAISAETNLESLLTQITIQVSETFNFYHVGVFLNDPTAELAVLRAANSPGGKRMLSRGHTLKVGQVGIVGYVTGTGQPRIALDVGEDATFFNNPDLPQTRSEMALPLKVRDRVIGALDVQSTERNAFSQEDIDTLSILADQIAIAIENARLLEETQQTLTEIQAVYGENISRAWERKTGRNPIGYHFSSQGGRHFREQIEQEESRIALETGQIHRYVTSEGFGALAVPIRFRDLVIGVVNIRASEPRRWRDDEVAIVEATVERLALALENARLFEETSGRAAREHAVADITSKIRQTNDPQVMIQTAIKELQRVLGVSRVELVPQKVSPPSSDNTSA